MPQLAHWAARNPEKIACHFPENTESAARAG